jgi:hypothetical protein
MSAAMKIGRNAPCHCGSGKKFKHCHGKLTAEGAPSSIPGFTEEQLRERARAVMRGHAAKENVRQQQGFGQPIISVSAKDHRIVAVKNRVMWGKWLVFTDFLMHFLKDTMGSEWGARDQANGSPHPIFRWLEKFKRLAASQQGIGDGRLKSGPIVGYIAALHQLGYALYLIAHHDQIPKPLLKRLRETLTFLPAYYETIVGAALAVAGFEITCAEKGPTSKATPEFHARSKTSRKVYDVEAKRKNRWTAPTDGSDEAAFRAELRGYIRDQIHKASAKKLTNPVFWLELSIPKIRDEGHWREVGEFSGQVVSEAKATMTIDGQPIPQAFVVITNHCFLADEDIQGNPTFGFLQAIRTPDYPFGKMMDVEDALQGYDNHRDIFKMMEGWKIAGTVPVTFDASPPELLSRDGEPQRTIQIGDTIAVPGPDGVSIPVHVDEIASAGDGKAMLGVHDPATKQSWIAQMPLTKGEEAAAARYTDAIFGKDNASKQLREGDPFDLYDWFLKAHQSVTPEQMNKKFEDEPGLHRFKDLPLDQKHIRYARELTKSMWIQIRTTREAKAAQKAPC